MADAFSGRECRQMSDSENETRYLFLDLTEQPNADESRKLAADFCSSYARWTDSAAEVIKTEADVLDAIVRIDREEIVLEFVRYHGDDAYLEIEQSESQLKGDVGAALRSGSSSRCQSPLYISIIHKRRIRLA